MIKDKIELLAQTIDVLRNANIRVFIETVDVRPTGYGAWTMEKTPQIPTQIGNYKNKPWWMSSQNATHACSIKIGNILIRDMGRYFILRSPNGEAKFDSYDNDLLAIWNAALDKYDNPNRWSNIVVSDGIGELRRYLSNQKLKKIVARGITKPEQKSGIDMAQKQLESLGVIVNKDLLLKQFCEIRNRRYR